MVSSGGRSCRRRGRRGSRIGCRGHLGDLGQDWAPQILRLLHAQERRLVDGAVNGDSMALGWKSLPNNPASAIAASPPPPPAYGAGGAASRCREFFHLLASALGHGGTCSSIVFYFRIPLSSSRSSSYCAEKTSRGYGDLQNITATFAYNAPPPCESRHVHVSRDGVDTVVPKGE